MTLQLGTDNREEEFLMNCKVTTVIKWFEDVDSKNNVTRQSTTMFLLVPEDSSQRTLFLDTWLPSYEEETYEVVGLLLSPINKPCRFGVRNKNKDYPSEHHLIMMTVDAEDEVRRMIDAGRDTIKVAILPSSKEEKFDV
jgi:hypothetical protein